MSKLRLFAYQVAVSMVGIGVFFSFWLGAVVAKGGEVTVTMTVFNEMWPEYWMLFVAVGVLPWALWYIERD